MKILRSVYILMPITILLSFLWVPAMEGHGEAGRIIFYHVPLAWVSVLAFLFSGCASILYLFDKKNCFSLLEEKAHASASIGLLFVILSVITGAIWAKISWGTFWNWDPRQKTIVILLAIYVAYFSLYSALEYNENRGRICSSYLIFAMVMVPIFIFVLPRTMAQTEGTLHPETIINTESKILMGERMKITLLISLASFTMLYFYILYLMNKLVGITSKIELINEE